MKWAAVPERAILAVDPVGNCLAGNAEWASKRRIVMLRIAIATALMVVTILPTAKAQQFTKADCATLGNGVPSMISTFDNLSKSTAAVAVTFAMYGNRFSPDAKKAADAVIKTAGDLSAELKNYKEALQDFSYQMQLCAR
jgi:hypothetical protein